MTEHLLMLQNNPPPLCSNSTNERGAYAYNVYVNDIDGDFELIPDLPFSDFGIDGYCLQNTGGQFIRRELD